LAFIITSVSLSVFWLFIELWADGGEITEKNIYLPLRFLAHRGCSFLSCVLEYLR